MRSYVYPVVAVAALTVALCGCGKPSAPPEQTRGPDGQLLEAVGATGGGIAGTLKLYVPCGMIIPIRAVMDEFEKAHSGVTIEASFDNAVVLADNITKKGKKADVFLSPGSAEVGRLKEAGLVDDDAVVAVGTFELVAITQRDSALQLDEPGDLLQCDTLSMPDPDINSVGASGKEALVNLGLWEQLEPKAVKTKHAIQSHTMVAGGKSQAGIAYRNCPLETSPDKLSTSKVRIAFSFPADSYERQQCLVATLEDAENAPAAKAFVDFISSAEGLQILADNGMTGCLDMAPSAQAPSGDAVVDVVAYYPGNEAHESIREMIQQLAGKYEGKVHGEFVAFTDKEGFDRWRAAGLSCGAILINDEQTWSIEKDGKPVEVTFKMAEGGEWETDDLYAVVEKLLRESDAG